MMSFVIAKEEKSYDVGENFIIKPWLPNYV